MRLAIALSFPSFAFDEIDNFIDPRSASNVGKSIETLRPAPKPISPLVPTLKCPREIRFVSWGSKPLNLISLLTIARGLKMRLNHLQHR